ncbi:MAG: hypothetical protein PHP51_01930 [Desulfotomaculaceae bacterium]|nr:hypothetical protein [Desulfotomaculaceae bacterium]MDD4766124.1 hypothetical protein [Desulfotomaculaceae bacterium]
MESAGELKFVDIKEGIGRIEDLSKLYTDALRKKVEKLERVKELDVSKAVNIETRNTNQYANLFLSSYELNYIK